MDNNLNSTLEINRSKYNPSSFLRHQVQPRRDLIHGRLPRGKLVLLAGEGGVGKSTILLHLFTAVTKGSGEFFGGTVLGGPLSSSILVFAEDDFDTVARRLQTITKGDFPDVGLILPMPNIGPHRLFTKDYQGDTPRRSDFLNWLDETLERENELNGGLGFIGLDPLAALFGIDENKSDEVQLAWSELAAIAVKYDVCIITTHHMRKGQGQGRESIRGSSALTDGVRAAYVVTKEENPNDILKQLGMPQSSDLEVLKVTLVKDNLGLHRSPIIFIQSTDGTLTDVTGQVQASGSIDEALLQLIKGYNTKGERVFKTGTRALFERKSSEWPQNLQGLGRDKLRSKVQGLIDSGKLLVEDEGDLVVAEA